MWPNARISVMGGDQAAAVLATVKRTRSKAPAAPGTPMRKKVPLAIRERYEAEGNAYYSTARLWDDGIIDPLETRTVLGLALSVCANAPLEDVSYGVFRM